VTTGFNLNLAYHGYGGGVSRTKSESKKGQLSISQIESDFINLTSTVSQARGGSPIIFQLNNLDLDHTFTEAELKKLLNNVRDPFIKSHCAWIVTGKTGLSSYIQKNTLRFKEITNQFITLQPLTKEEVSQAIGERLKQAKFSGDFPIKGELFDCIYTASDGSFRTILVTMQKLFFHFETIEKKEINLKDACDYFFKQSAYRLNEAFKKYKFAKESLIYITKKRDARLKDLSEHLNLDTANTRRLMLDLEKDSLLISTKFGKNRRDPRTYQTREEIYFAMMNYEQK
jgi:hypothetical protein